MQEAIGIVTHIHPDYVDELCLAPQGVNSAEQKKGVAYLFYNRL